MNSFVKSAPSGAALAPPRLRRCRSSLEIAKDVTEEVWLITRLAWQLLWALRVSSKWIIMAIRLFCFVFFLLPALLRVLWFWAFHPNVHKNIQFGLNPRNLLDVYTVDTTNTKLPVIVFISGGAWIIGYKAWGALMGKVISQYGIIFVTPDYRNFPQGIMPDMVADTNQAIQWVFEHIHHFGGDPNKITLIGQSAGAHISACCLIDQVVKESQEKIDSHKKVTSWKPSRLCNFIGISGPYNMVKSMDYFHHRGLDRTIMRKIMDNDLSYYSPTLRLQLPQVTTDVAKCFPPIQIFHGDADETVPFSSSEEFVQALRDKNSRVKMKIYKGKSHTDPIIEDPIYGNDPLLKDIIEIIRSSSRSSNPDSDINTFVPVPSMLPHVLIKLARKVNPF